MEYRVLARKYRPATFADLIGQDVLVTTLTNAMNTGRIAHAFLLTGIRGVGKTTTARIIARALNCIGADGKGGPTTNPCGTCANCIAIAEDRHVDVLEMDAASHTGVGDIRELIDTVRYLPSMARYKIYIIDEVHMLSTSAFNALLKTLEEPPPHVKFIFATTESRKIPVTILSRCQRFDLKRIETEVLAKHLANICGKENTKAAEDALKLIAVSAEGSVRDALSLLDQAMANGKAIEADMVRHMIGSADNTVTFRLLEALLAGHTGQALAELQSAYKSGTEPLHLVQQLLETVHLVTRMKISSDAKHDITLSQHDREHAAGLAEKLSMPNLTRLWQMLLKGITEVKVAPSPLAALEMLLVRVAYAAELPTPAEAIRSSAKEPAAPVRLAEPAPAQKKTAMELLTPKPSVQLNNFPELVALFSKNREPLLYTRLKNDAHLVRFSDGELQIRFNGHVNREDIGRINDCLKRWTGREWKIAISDQPGDATLHEQEDTNKKQKIEAATGHPLVASVLEQFPGAEVVGVNE